MQPHACSARPLDPLWASGERPRVADHARAGADRTPRREHHGRDHSGRLHDRDRITILVALQDATSRKRVCVYLIPPFSCRRELCFARARAILATDPGHPLKPLNYVIRGRTRNMHGTPVRTKAGCKHPQTRHQRMHALHHVGCRAHGSWRYTRQSPGCSGSATLSANLNPQALQTTLQ